MHMRWGVFSGVGMKKRKKKHRLEDIHFTALLLMRQDISFSSFFLWEIREVKIEKKIFFRRIQCGTC